MRPVIGSMWRTKESELAINLNVNRERERTSAGGVEVLVRVRWESTCDSRGSVIQSNNYFWAACWPWVYLMTQLSYLFSNNCYWDRLSWLIIRFQSVLFILEWNMEINRIRKKSGMKLVGFKLWPHPTLTHLKKRYSAVRLDRIEHVLRLSNLASVCVISTSEKVATNYKFQRNWAPHVI